MTEVVQNWNRAKFQPLAEEYKKLQEEEHIKNKKR